MSEFQVNTEKMRELSAGLSTLGTGMDNVAAQLGGIRINTSLSFAATVAMNIRIHDCMRAAQNQGDNLRNLAQGLNEIVDLYQQHENAIISNANGEGTPETPENQPPVDPTEGMTYDEILEYRAENAVDENTARLYERYRNNVDINDDDYDGTAHYNSSSNEINYNAENDATNVRGPGCTYYHEVGHLIDDQSDWFGNTSTDGSYDFYECLQEDVDAWIRRCMEENGYTDINDAYDALSDWLCQDPNMKNGISDLIKGLTEGQASGHWGHSMDYYDESSISKEAFAHFFEAAMSHDPTKLDYIREMFPSAYEEYQQMIQDELGD